ncbi:hypothetical protein HMI54_006166 [Coelomomyces lativittatus]|nr:hypothetical protein HMI56_002101 [Coelomomyces lativittatus]KAJ1505208.1 hypothetical protein HMI54_006166 [Coelomomyces lativittatus]
MIKENQEMLSRGKERFDSPLFMFKWKLFFGNQVTSSQCFSFSLDLTTHVFRSTPNNRQRSSRPSPPTLQVTKGEMNLHHTPSNSCWTQRTPHTRLIVFHFISLTNLLLHHLHHSPLKYLFLDSRICSPYLSMNIVH